MVLPRITSRRVAPYVLTGASGVHIIVRMWQLSRQPASDRPLHLFLLKNTDVLLVLTGDLVVWYFAQRRQQHATQGNLRAGQTDRSVIQQVAHHLRQVFTVLLLGLGLIKRKISNRQANEIPGLVERLQNVVAEGIQAVNVLDPPDRATRDGREREFDA